MNVSILNEL